MTTEQILKPEYKKAIKDDKGLQYKISQVNKGKLGNAISYRTLETWLRTDSDNLTKAATLQVIKEHLKLDASEILVESKEEVTADLQS